MKAWLITIGEGEDAPSTVIFAPNKQRARQYALSTDIGRYADYHDVRAARFVEMDRYYYKNKGFELKEG